MCSRPPAQLRPAIESSQDRAGKPNFRILIELVFLIRVFKPEPAMPSSGRVPYRGVGALGRSRR